MTGLDDLVAEWRKTGPTGRRVSGDVVALPVRSVRRAQQGRPLTRVFSRPPVPFHTSSVVPIIDSNSLAASRSSQWRTVLACLVAVQKAWCRFGVLLEVLGLEVVVPQHVQVVLDQPGALLLLDVDGARLEVVVVACLVRPDDLVAGLGLGAGLLGS